MSHVPSGPYGPRNNLGNPGPPKFGETTPLKSNLGGPAFPGAGRGVNQPPGKS